MLMRFIVGSPVRVLVKGVHVGCWSTDERLKHPIKILDFRMMDNYLRMLLLIHKDDRKPLLERLRQTYRVFILTSATKYSNDKVILSFIKNVNKISVPKTIDQYHGFFLNATYDQGIERWDFLIPSQHLDYIVEGLKSIMINTEIKIKEYKPLSEMELTEKEKEILETAVKLGYFEFPRKVNLEDLSKTLNISPSTLLYHIRNIEKKIMLKLVNDGKCS
jgi:predicted DNA binding protein